MTNATIQQIALKQSAIDSNCQPNDFLSEKNRVVISAQHLHARKYLELPFYCDLTSYGTNIVASVHTEFETKVTSYLNRYSPSQCFETPHLHILNSELEKHGMSICFMAEYFLPDVNSLKPLPVPDGITIKTLYPKDFASLYTPQWSNALCSTRKQHDVLALAAYDGNKLVGLAGCSADCNTMWQIGIDVVPVYRKKGIASVLVSHLSHAVLQKNLVPFYCAAWSNIKSVRTALASGFKPSWVQLTAKSTQFVSKMNT